MVAERIQFSPVSQPRQQTVLVMFAEESAAERWVARLAELNIEAEQMSVLRVALGTVPTRIPPTTPSTALLSSQYVTVGILAGCGIAFLLGLLLYATNFLQLSLLEALLVHTLALMILGGVLGGAAGAIYASAQAQKQAALLLPQSTDGFIVVMKVAPHCTAQCEALAREFGARKVLA